VLIPNIAPEPMRYGVSSTATAALVNATLNDYKTFINVERCFHTLLVHPSKIHRLACSSTIHSYIVFPQ